MKRPPPGAKRFDSDKKRWQTRNLSPDEGEKPLREYMPEARESEQALIAQALDEQANVCFPAQDELLRVAPRKFWEPTHRTTAQAIHALGTRGESINPVTVFDELKRMGAVGQDMTFPMFADFQAMYQPLPLAFTIEPHDYALNIHRAYAGRLAIDWGAQLAQIGMRNVPGEMGAALGIMQLEMTQAEREADENSASARMQFMDITALKQRVRAGMLDPEIGLRERHLALVYGASNSGKSLYVLMRLVFLAAGKIDGTPRHVAYLCGEGLEGIADRLQGIILRHGLDYATVNEHLHILPDVPQLASPEDVTAVIIAAREIDEPLALVVVDTLATATEGINENASDEMGAALGGARRMGNELDCAVLLVHHAGKDETRGSRGWTGLPGKMDVSVEVSKAEGSDIVTVRCKKMRDGPYFPDFAYRIIPFALDEYGDVHTAVLDAGAEPIPMAPRSQANKQSKALSPAQLIVWEVLNNAPTSLRYGEWQKLTEIKGLNRDTFKSAQERLEKLNRVGKDQQGRWVAIPEAPDDSGLG